MDRVWWRSNGNTVLILWQDQILQIKPEVVKDVAMMAIIPLVSGQLSTANSTCSATLESANVMKTSPSRLMALAVCLRLRCSFLALAMYWENEWFKDVKVWKIYLDKFLKIVSFEISEWESWLKNCCGNAKLIGFRMEILSVLLHFPSRGGMYKLLEVTVHLHGIFITQNVQPFRICWPFEQSKATVAAW